jgi:hypothetical protein
MEYGSLLDQENFLAMWSKMRTGRRRRTASTIASAYRFQCGTQMDWVDVPDEAVTTEPNRAGRTMVWPRYGDGDVSIRCFIPGSMT